MQITNYNARVWIGPQFGGFGVEMFGPQPKSTNGLEMEPKSAHAARLRTWSSVERAQSFPINQREQSRQRYYYTITTTRTLSAWSVSQNRRGRQDDVVAERLGESSPSPRRRKRRKRERRARAAAIGCVQLHFGKIIMYLI